MVGMISLRLLSGFSVGTMPASARSGRVSSRMRPLDSAMVNMGNVSPYQGTHARSQSAPDTHRAGTGSTQNKFPMWRYSYCALQSYVENRLEMLID
ncbi:hypothetical protein EMIT0215P_100183 [Pseudomonas serboccidentalis]